MEFNGSFLGSYSINILSDIYIGKRGYIYAKISATTGIHPVILMREDKYINFFCLADELKEIFGIEKTGSHSILLDKRIEKDGRITSRPQRYAVIKAEYNHLTNNYIEHWGADIRWLPKLRSQLRPWHREVAWEIDKLLVFRKIILVSETSYSDILLTKRGRGRLHPFTVNDNSTSLFKKGREISWLPYFGEGMSRSREANILKYFSEKVSLINVRETIMRIDERYEKLADLIEETLD